MDYSIGDLNLNAEQRSLVSSIINRYGSGQHPVCDEQTFNGFYLKYFQQVIKKKRFVKSLDNLSEKGKQVWNEILNVLNEP